MSGDDRAPLDELQTAAQQVAQVVAGGRARWDADPIRRLAGQGAFQRFTEATVRLPGHLKDELSQVDWREWQDARNFAAHEQRNFNHDELWNSMVYDVRNLDQTVTLYRTNKLDRRSLAERLGSVVDRSGAGELGRDW